MMALAIERHWLALGWLSLARRRPRKFGRLGSTRLKAARSVSSARFALFRSLLIQFKWLAMSA